jgi:stringent starvation protein B
MNGTPLPPKKEVALALLERGSVHVHLDPRAGGVVVPAWFKRQPQLVLQVGLNMPVPIPDLRVDADGMSCTLSFNRSPFFCIVPWSAVFAMVGDDSRGMVWPDDVPPEVATQARSREAEPAAKKSSPPRALTSVKPPAESPARLPASKAAGKTAGAGKAGAKASPKPVRAADDAAQKPKKSRAKKGAVVAAPEVTSPTARGVLISIPSAAKGARPTAEPAARPAPRPEAVRVAPKAAPQAAPEPGPTKPEAPPPPPARKPGGGKTKREIPPYLRVVK